MRTRIRRAAILLTVILCQLQISAAYSIPFEISGYPIYVNISFKICATSPLLVSAMGRSKNQTIWRHYNQLPDNSVKCSFCEKNYKKGHVIKMRQHLLTCLKCPQAVKKQIKEANKSQSDLSPENTTTSLNLENTSTENISDLREEFAKALLITGTPLVMVEHPLWVNFFEKLNFKLPSRKAVSTKYLDKIYKEMSKEISDDLKASNFLHLQCDGWTDICNEGIINFLISKPEPVFINSLNTLDNRHTSEYLSCETEKVMKSYGMNKFVVIIGDNARNLQKSFEMIKNKYPHIVPLNCAAHTLNLLCFDFLKPVEVKAFIDLSTDVIKSIKKSQVLSALLSKIRKEKSSSQSLKLPCKTRWGSHVGALKSLKINKAALQTLAVNENLQPTPDIKSTLLDEDFWSMIDQCISVLEPVADSIFKLEGNEFNIHEVFMVLRNLKSKLEFVLPSITMLDDENKENIKTSIEKRVKQCVKPIHYAAYLLDPKSAGIELNQMEETEAMEFICDLAEHCNIDSLADLAQYKGKEGLWSKQFTWKAAEKVSPILWWKGICGSSQLSKVALRILTAPCTSAATERSFSTQGFIHSAKRNRLTSERAAKITFLAYNWNLLNKSENIHRLFNEDTVPESSDMEDTDDDILCKDATTEGHIEDRWEAMEPVASTSRQTNEIQFVNISEQLYDTDSD